MENIINNIGAKSHNSDLGLKGVELARHYADENQKATGNKTVVRRILEYTDYYNGDKREHFSFDIVELLDN